MLENQPPPQLLGSKDRRDDRENSENTLKIGCFGYHDFKDVHCGMLQKPIQNVLEGVFDYPLDPLHKKEDNV